MNIVDCYLYNIGVLPEQGILDNIQKTVSCLQDNEFTDKEIFNILMQFNGMNDISIKNLPDSLWDNSLLKRNIYYYHNELHITSKPSYYDAINKEVISPHFFMEMKIKYTQQDLLNYIYKKLPDLKKYSDEKKDLGAVNYLLNKYKKYDFISEIDFLLFLVDEAYYQYRNVNAKFVDILNLDEYKVNVIDKLESKVKSAEAEHKNRIIWR